jgi:hypothetical protein
MVGFLGLADLFVGRHFDREVIVLCVKWYLRFKLSYRDLAEMMAERGLSIVHTTIMRWVHRYVPEFDGRWNRFARPVGALLAGRRDLREDPWRVGVFVPGGGSRGEHRGLPPEQQARRRRGQGVLSSGDEKPGIVPRNHYVGWLRRVTPRGARDES